MNETITLRDFSDLGTCVCGRPIGMGYLVQKPVVVHEMPFCEAFEIMGPIDFLTYVRKAKGLKDEIADADAYGRSS